MTDYILSREKIRERVESKGFLHKGLKKRRASMETIRNHKHLIIITILSLVVQLGLIFGQYCGNFYWILWPSNHFNPPIEVTSAYHGPLMIMEDKVGGVGWDGQFYYLMSRDPFMLKPNFNQGIDHVSYRYQRVGLAIFTKTVSLFFGQENPSPFLYWFINNCIFLVGLVLLSQLFRMSQISQMYLWFWGFGVGTQSVVFHGLPDAFADTFFISSLFLMARNQWSLSALLGVVTVLTRETYAVVYGVLFGFWFMERFLSYNYSRYFKFGFDFPFDHLKFKRQAWLYFLPCIATVGWRGYIVSQTGVQPSSGLWGLLIDFPFKAAFFNLGSIYLVEVIMTLFFIFIVGYSLFALWQSRFNILSIALIPSVLLIASMGPGVFGLFRDYLKGLSPLLVILPFLLLKVKPQLKGRWLQVFFAFMILQPFLYFGLKYKERKFQRECQKVSSQHIEKM